MRAGQLVPGVLCVLLRLKARQSTRAGRPYCGVLHSSCRVRALCCACRGRTAGFLALGGRARLGAGHPNGAREAAALRARPPTGRHTHRNPPFRWPRAGCRGTGRRRCRPHPLHTHQGQAVSTNPVSRGAAAAAAASSGNLALATQRVKGRSARRAWQCDTQSIPTVRQTAAATY